MGLSLETRNNESRKDYEHPDEAKETGGAIGPQDLASSKIVNLSNDDCNPTNWVDEETVVDPSVATSSSQRDGGDLEVDITEGDCQILINSLKDGAVKDWRATEVVDQLLEKLKDMKIRYVCRDCNRVVDDVARLNTEETWYTNS